MSERGEFNINSNSNISMMVYPSMGIRFRPTDEEVVEYLAAAAAKDTNRASRSDLIIDYDVYSCPPWHLPRHLFEYSSLQNDMYFVSKRRPKNEGGSKVDRSTAGGTGFWYYNSKRISVKNCNGKVIGIKTSLNYMRFKEGCSSSSTINNKNKKKKVIKKEKEKTSWIMHEYTIAADDPITRFQDVVLCHIYDSSTDKIPKRVTIIDEEEEEEEEGITNDQLALLNHQDHTTLCSSSSSLSSYDLSPLPDMMPENNDRAQIAVNDQQLQLLLQGGAEEEQHADDQPSLSAFPPMVPPMVPPQNLCGEDDDIWDYMLKTIDCDPMAEDTSDLLDVL